MKTHPQARFTWNAKTRMFVAEISDLGRDNPFTQRNSLLLETTNGKVIQFFPVGVDRNGEGEVMGWRLRNEAEKMEMLIIND